MDAADIVSICISFLALIVSLFFSIWNAMPHIKILITHSLYTTTLNFLAVSVKFTNSSQIAGTVSNAYIKVNGKRIYCIQVGDTFNTESIKFETVNGTRIIPADEEFKAPFEILPFKVKYGIFVFPNFSSEREIIKLNLYVKFTRITKHFTLKARRAEHIAHDS